MADPIKSAGGVQRYSVAYAPKFLGRKVLGMDQNPDGGWIMYRHHQAAIAATVEEMKDYYIKLDASRRQVTALMEVVKALVMGNDIAYDRKMTMESWPDSSIRKMAVKALEEHSNDR
jgi:hypothetical protein